MHRILLLLALLSFGAFAQPCKLVMRSERIGSGAIVYNLGKFALTDYQLERQVDLLREFTQPLKIAPMDLAGTPILRDKIRGSELDGFSGGGHLLHAQSAAAVAPIYTTFLDAVTPAATRLPADDIAVTFTCDAGKGVRAVFIDRAQPQVDLVLSDGRRLSLPQAKSASGARYANRDESIVFWNKGNGAFIEEQGKRTYDNCVERH